jgi:hypothetical protein
VWILEHTLQVGVEKCLLILGVRLREVRRADRVLSHEDVEPIALFPVTRSNGAVVFQQLEEAIDKTGLPREILGDQRRPESRHRAVLPPASANLLDRRHQTIRKVVTRSCRQFAAQAL